MNDPVTNYYLNQAGSGIPGFAGVRYQKGGGFFSSLWSKIGLPVLKFLGKQAVDSGLNIASDTINGRSFKESAIDNFKNSGRNTIGYLKELNKQSGSGIKRKRKASTKGRVYKKKRKIAKRSVSKKKPKAKGRKKTKKRKSLFD